MPWVLHLIAGVSRDFKERPIFLNELGVVLKNTYELFTVRALKISTLVSFEIPYKFLTHTLKDAYFIGRWKCKGS